MEKGSAFTLSQERWKSANVTHALGLRSIPLCTLFLVGLNLFQRSPVQITFHFIFQIKTTSFLPWQTMVCMKFLELWHTAFWQENIPFKKNYFSIEQYCHCRVKPLNRKKNYKHSVLFLCVVIIRRNGSQLQMKFDSWVFKFPFYVGFVDWYFK